MDFDPLFLSRMQFGFVISFHIIFPSFTIGLASWLAYLEGAWLLTHDDRYQRLYDFWVKIFALSFGLGVVSGIVMSFQFGTNWAELSSRAGNILGPLLNYEVLTAFFLEASFLGIMLFGRNRVGKKVHFFATVMVALGTLISTFWIISANSWMHTPAGYVLQDGVFFPDDWWQIVFNPSFPYRLAHMVLAAFLTTSFAIAAVAAFYLLRGTNVSCAKLMLKNAAAFMCLVVPLQFLAGDLHGLNVQEHQPAKLAAMEGHWETKRGAPLILFAWPDETAEKNHVELGIPKLASLILQHDIDGEVVGLKDFPKADRPPVKPVFFAFRVMLAVGVAMLLAAIWAGISWWRGNLATNAWLHRYLILLGPSGFVAILAGWYTAEIGRQPYVVYGLLRTADAHSAVSAGEVLTSFLAFVLVYAFVFGAGSWYLIKLLRKGPGPHDDVANDSVPESPARPISVAE